MTKHEKWLKKRLDKPNERIKAAADDALTCWQFGMLFYTWQPVHDRLQLIPLPHAA